MKKKIVAVVLAAGEGKRMGSNIPKQYMIIKSKPMIYYALKSFQNSPVDEVVLVTGSDEIEYCRQYIVEKYHFDKVKHVVPGGRERSESVYLGLKEIENADYVLIHDGARPMLDATIIQRCIKSVVEYRACVVGMPIKDTVKMVDTNQIVTTTPPRKYLWQVQTPQCFEYDLVYDAYKQLKEEDRFEHVTDDGSVVELYTDVKVKIIHGSYDNIKVTTPEDVRIAGSLFKAKKLFRWLHVMHDKLIYIQMLIFKMHHK
ncbi:MAG: 2-C-methyl-D-erythritol 4-phosphate cytidylyltransferase [Anaerostipes sp.]|nr:2-C-methyl-D-erythritol 4-phosphate cytidylyltransferase [Anaerostipes sp.]MDD3747654.1 2-C-methyl-D-erythritol 4-phosphate cytidylyltransferase [Anaerostipes sp.]